MTLIQRRNNVVCQLMGNSLRDEKVNKNVPTLKIPKFNIPEYHFHPLEVVSRYSDTQLQVGEKSNKINFEV